MSTNPVQHDTRLLELYRQLAKAEQMLGWKTAQYRHESLTRTDPRQHGFRVKDTRTIAEVAVDMQARRDDVRVFWTDPARKFEDPERMIAYNIGELDKTEAGYTEAAEAVQAVWDSIAAHELGYTGWQRFFLVTSSTGLVHESMHCSTCNKGRQLTTFALLPSFSGRAVDGLVDLVGPALCSVCFPQAPTEWTDAVRIPGRIAEQLLSLGEDEFRAELAKYKTKQAAKAAKKGS